MQLETNWCKRVRISQIFIINILQESCLRYSVKYDVFLVDRTNGRAIGTVLRLSSVVVCNVMYCA